MSSFRLIVTLIFVLTFTFIQGAPSSQELQLTQALKSETNSDLSEFSEPQLATSLSDGSLSDSSRPIKVGQFDESGTRGFGNMSPGHGRLMNTPGSSMNDEQDNEGMDDFLNPRHRSEDLGLNLGDDEFQRSKSTFGSNSQIDGIQSSQATGTVNRNDDMDNIDQLLASNNFESEANNQRVKHSNAGHDDILPLSSGDVEASRVMEGLNEDRITAEIEDLQAKLGSLQANIDKVLSEVA